MSSRTVKQAYKYRFYPDTQQRESLNRTFGSVRYVYNRALAERHRAWFQDQQRVGFAETCRMLTVWKQEPEKAWLSEVSNVALQQGLQHLQRAYLNFWGKRAKYPTFKSKDEVHDAPGTTSAVGVDAGIAGLLTLSTGEKVTNPKHEKADRERLVKAQRRLARKEKGSNNRAKARLKVAMVHARIADRRRDHLHKLSTRIIRENQTVVIEDLAVRNMVRNRSLARAISDAAWSQLRCQLEYKAQWYGRTVIAIDRFYPSSKTCSACGRINPSMPLDVRKWTCPCGATHDRDVNAAVNILAAGLAVSACGDGVRPART